MADNTKACLKLTKGKCIKLFKNKKDLLLSFSLDRIFENGLGDTFVRCVERYLSVSKRKDVEFIAVGSTSSCYRVGDYVFKLVRMKWSYEEIICPNIYLIAKNLEEFHKRDSDNDVYCGFEVQKYLGRDAGNVPSEVWESFKKEFNNLGYYTTDTWMGGPCGDNCRILDSYKDADCKNPEKLPKWFKKLPLVLIDRDRVYSNDKEPKEYPHSSY